MTIIRVGIFQILPFIGATAGILLAGYVSDLLIRRGFSMSAARKAPLITGTLLASAIVLVNYVTSDAAIIAILTVAFFAQGIAASSWAAVSEVAPKQFIGLTSGITSLAANLAGVSTPLAGDEPSVRDCAPALTAIRVARSTLLPVSTMAAVVVFCCKLLIAVVDASN